MAQPAQAKKPAPTTVTIKDQVRDIEVTLKQMQSQMVSALPASIPFPKFVSTVLTAIVEEPDLLRCDRRTLFLSTLKCARDGLLPDKREAALVPYRDGDNATKVVQYMPMVAGLLKKVRNSGQLASLSANAIYAEDQFSYTLGDDEKIIHVPAWRKSRGHLVGAYAIAKTKDGNIYRRVLGLEDIEAIKAASKAKKGPWHGPFESEMWIKSAIRRLSKLLPQSSDIDAYLNQGPPLPGVSADMGTVLPDNMGEAGNQQAEFDLKSRALLALNDDSVDLETLAGHWQGIKQEYAKLDVEIPLEVEDVYQRKFEAFNDKAKETK